jgi:hypothetical protein
MSAKTARNHAAAKGGGSVVSELHFEIDDSDVVDKDFA